MRRRRYARIVSVMVLAAFSSVTAWAGASSAVGGGEGGDSRAGVTVPDAFTPLTLAPVSESTFPFLGTDGQYHVVYDLQLTNASNLPATLERIDVVDARRPKTVVASFTGDQLVDPDCDYGDCNRFRMLPSADAPDLAVGPQESRALLIDFTFDALDDVPDTVMHHLYGTGKPGPPAQEPVPVDYVVTPFDISAGSPRVIAAPVRGKNWIALNGCCEPGFPHRGSLNSLNGKLTNSQRFAIDWKRANNEGEFYTGDRTQNESYVDYGAKIYAVADGTVVSTLDEVEANAPGTLPVEDPALASMITIANVDGNHIILDIGDGVYAMYAHLIKGSLEVEPGDKVEEGDVIAELGNTGNANASHLHFQLMDGPSLLDADGLPYVIDRFLYEGQVDPQQIVDADDYLGGSYLQGKLPEGEPRRNELPVLLAIVNFPRT